MIIRAGTVVTMDGPPIENGAVAVSGSRITNVGKFSEISAANSGEQIVDLGEQALLPGLINAHCHLDYTCLCGKIPASKSFTEWIRAINAEKANLSPEDYIRSINDGFAEAKRFGTTTIANLTAFPELVSRIQPPIRTWWLAELIDVREPGRANEIVDAALEKLKSTEHWGLAPHAPFTTSAKLYRRCEEIARSEDVPLTTHLAESCEEMSMFRDACGPLYKFLKEIGRDMSDCGHETPLHRFLDLIGRGGSPNRSEPDGRSRAIEVNRPYLMAHLNELVESDFDLLRRSKPNFHIIHCPRSHKYFGHSAFQFETLRELGNVCLGTDSLASNDDLSLFAEMRAFQKEFPKIPPDEIFRMVTLNPALALGKPHVLGRIGKNCWADLIAVPITGSTLAFEEIVAFDRVVSWLMVDGQVQNRD
jgi:cytosine/adenosine deaminase-related metal-dependent hydrolase